LVNRMATLARELAPAVGADPDMAEKAARLAKADLSSEMVYEFPELQGLMGRYYIEASGEDAQIAAAAEEHYAPLGPSDDVPTAPVSVAVSLAEKIDKLTGFWAIDEKPTGSKDPFALRRAALGVIRIVAEGEISASLLKSISASLFVKAYFEHYVPTLMYSNYVNSGDPKFLNTLQQELSRFRSSDFNADWSDEDHEALVGEASSEAERMKLGNDGLFHGTLKLYYAMEPIGKSLLSFFHDRLKVYLKDQGIRHDIIDACIAMDGNDDINLLVKRARALSETLKTDDGKNLIQGFKRANNILSQAEAADGVEYSYGADVKFAETEEERSLFGALDRSEVKIKPAMEAQDFASAMSAMATLRTPIDAFFEAVQINADNPTVRRNRLNLLSRIRTVCSSVADLTKIEG
jgi:glycyl-tRNA synthetase beta chain